ALAIILFGQDGDFTRLHVGTNHATPADALLAALATDQPALGIEAIAVSAAAVGAKGGHRPPGVHFEDAIAGDVAEEDVARGIDSGAFEETDDRCRCRSTVLADQSLWWWHLGQILARAQTESGPHRCGNQQQDAENAWPRIHHGKSPVHLPI